MKKLLIALSFGLAVLAYHAEVHAACTSHTIFTSDGRMIICMTCCYYGNCTTTCT